MIFAAALINNTLDSQINNHFGRCRIFGIYNTETKAVSFIENPFYDLDEEAGCKTAEFLLQHKINFIIAGRFGIKTVSFFQQENIQMIIPENNQTFREILKLK
ncbi:MAG: NifB/NifX family molybdenum-iron cluster-binding protein [Bacteroidota bacterium]|nr:NifB/NifX family molybdenum-iron cluster-binding protein [Bacteroidota bacterium]